MAKMSLLLDWIKTVLNNKDVFDAEKADIEHKKSCFFKITIYILVT